MTSHCASIAGRGDVRLLRPCAAARWSERAMRAHRLKSVHDNDGDAFRQDERHFMQYDASMGVAPGWSTNGQLDGSRESCVIAIVVRMTRSRCRIEEPRMSIVIEGGGAPDEASRRA